MNNQKIKMASMVLLALSFANINSSFAQSTERIDLTYHLQNDHANKVVDYLFNNNDANLQDEQGCTPLWIAANEGALKAATVLLDWNATKVDLPNRHDETPLMMAALKGHRDMLLLLITHGAEVNKQGWTPLHYAATGGHVELMKILLENHAYIDTESPNHSTPLMLAAMYGNEESVQLLLKEGADVSIKNKKGYGAVDFARQAKRNDLADLILNFKNSIENESDNLNVKFNS